MATDRFNIGTKFETGDIPSQSDFKEIFDSFVHKDEDKADFQMVEAGISNEHYVTPALLYNGLKNIGIITGNCYMPHKEYFESTFSGTSLSLEKLPIQYSVKLYKNGQLLQEGEDYAVDYNTAVITFSAPVSDRNLEVNYWYKNLGPNPGGEAGEPIDFTSFLHTSGNETKNGLLTFNNTTAASTSGIVLTNSATGTTSASLDVNVSGTGSGVSVQNSAAGKGVKLSNTGAGVGAYLNSTSASVGDVLQVAKDDVVKTKIDANGIVTAPKYVTSGGTASEFVKGDGSLDNTVYAKDTEVLHTTGNESKDGALTLTHDSSPQDVLTISKNNSANCLKLVQNSNSNATTSTWDTSTANVNRKAISIKKQENEKAFITHDGNVTATSFTTLSSKADITDGLLSLASSASPTASQDHAKLYAKNDGTNTDMYVMGSDGVEKKIGAGGGDLDNVLHKTGFSTETKTGELVIDSGTTDVSGLKLNRITQTRSSYATVPSYSYGLISIGNTFYRAGNFLVKIENQIASTIGIGMGAGYSIFYNNVNNKIYVGGNSSRIRSMNIDGSNNVIVAEFSVPNQNFYGITIASDNNIYVLEYSTGNIHRSTLEGVKTENIANIGLDLNSGLISGNNGFIYASHDKSIKKIDIATGLVTNFITITKRISSLFLHSDGYIYINTIDSVARVLLDGTNLTENWISGLLSPNRAVLGICSQGGELYVADGVAISKLIQSQKALKTDSTGLVMKATYLEDVPYVKADQNGNPINQVPGISLDSPNFTGIPTAPTAVTGTNTTQIATTAFVQSNARPYKVYAAKITQNGTNIPTLKILENNTGLTFAISRLSAGSYSLTYSSEQNSDKIIAFMTLGGNNNSTEGHTYHLPINNTNIYILTFKTESGGTTTQVDGLLFEASLEIRIYN